MGQPEQPDRARRAQLHSDEGCATKRVGHAKPEQIRANLIIGREHKLVGKEQHHQTSAQRREPEHKGEQIALRACSLPPCREQRRRDRAEPQRAVEWSAGETAGAQECVGK